MTSSFYLFADGVTTYFSPPNVQRYNGTGSPWTSNDTSPFRLSISDVTGPLWTPQAAPQEAITSGGPPLRIGRVLMYTANGNVIEQVPMHLYATSEDNAIALKHRLHRILNTALMTVPCVLGFKPDDTTNTAFFEIYRADVQEDPRFIHWEAEQGLMRVIVTWERSPRAAGTATSLLSNQTLGNVGTGSPDNLLSLGSSFPGEFWAGEGALLNLQLKNDSTDSNTVWLATVNSASYNSVATAKTTSTSTDYTALPTTVSLSVDARKHRAMRGRVVARFTTFTNLAQARLTCAVYDLGVTSLLYSSTRSALNSTASFIDFGSFDLSFFRRAVTHNPQVAVAFTLSSADGTSVTATLDYFEVLSYYDFCRIGPGANISSTNYVYVEQYTDLTGSGHHRSVKSGAFLRRVSGEVPIRDLWVAGRLPRARTDSSGTLTTSLWGSWVNASNQHDKTDTMKVYADCAPQYVTLRGAA